ncbi:MAG: response regulator [Bdellovibrionota bacterium]
MFKSDLKLLLVEDDKKLGEIIQEFLEKDGYVVEWVTTPKEATQLAQRMTFHAVVSDIMLPQKSGVDMIEDIKPHLSEDTPIYFMSGIYRDKKFIKNTLRKTGAKDFLVKPFDISILVDFLNQDFSGTVVADLSVADRILFQPDYTKRDLTAALEQTETIHSLELPIYLSKLVSQKVSGHLSLSSTDTGDTSVIELNHGHITSVKVKDPKSVFGQLLVEKGFLSHEELEATLAQPGNKRIGEKLIDANLLSPHAIEIVNAEQLAIRLSLLIGDFQYDIEFKETPGTETNLGISQRMFSGFVSDWVQSKYPSEWLSLYFTKLLDHNFLVNKMESGDALLLNPVLSKINGFKEIITPKENLSSILTKANWKENDLYQALIFLICHDFVFFDSEANEQDLNTHMLRMEKLLTSAKKQDYFQVLGVPKGAKAEEIKKSYRDLAKLFHPDKLPSKAPMELKDTTKEYFGIVSKAHDILTSPESREAYVKELEQGQAKIRLQQEALIEEAKEKIKLQKYKDAKDLVDEAVSLFNPTPEIHLYSMWMKLKNLPETGADTILREIHEDLNRIPPEDRHNATYYFVKGLFQKYIGEKASAKKNLEHAVGLAPGFIEAKRELNVINIGGSDGPIDLMNADLKDVVGMLFKKKRR